MNVRTALGGIVLVVGCADVFQIAKPSANEKAARPASVAGVSSAAEKPADLISAKPKEAASALQYPTALGRFFEALAKLDAGQAVDDVRIVQFGDSHTAADIETAVVRQALQARFGDGGRGFVPIGMPGYHQDGIRSGASGGWFGERKKRDREKFSSDGLNGLGGIGIGSSRRGARAWTEFGARTSRAELSYLEQPNGGSFDVFVDGTRLIRLSTRAARAGSAFYTFNVAESTAHQVDVRNVGNGSVRIFGMALDRSQNGVMFDALGINGARVTTCLRWNEPHWAEQLRHRSPSLVVLAYGTNESTDESMSADAYEGELADVLGRIARAVPSASCLLLGPPDRAVWTEGSWVTSSKLLQIIASQKRVADVRGCAFYDQFEAMGGAGTMAAWATETPPRAQSDRVHFTRNGYAQLGSSFASDLIDAYAAWRRDKGLGPGAQAPVATEQDQEH